MSVYEKMRHSWVYILKAISHNSWINQNDRKSIFDVIENGISEDVAKDLCDKYNRKIEDSITLWRSSLK